MVQRWSNTALRLGAGLSTLLTASVVWSQSVEENAAESDETTAAKSLEGQRNLGVLVTRCSYTGFGAGVQAGTGRRRLRARRRDQKGREHWRHLGLPLPQLAWQRGCTRWLRHLSTERDGRWLRSRWASLVLFGGRQAPRKEGRRPSRRRRVRLARARVQLPDQHRHPAVPMTLGGPYR